MYNFKLLQTATPNFSQTKSFFEWFNDNAKPALLFMLLRADEQLSNPVFSYECGHWSLVQTES